MLDTNAIVFELNGIGIHYGFRVAVEGLSFTLHKGKALGLLGANGAGKTSTIRALLGMVKPKSGRITVFGDSPGKTSNFRRIGFAPEDGSPPEYLTALEYLDFIGNLKVRSKEERKTDTRATRLV